MTGYRGGGWLAAPWMVGAVGLSLAPLVSSCALSFTSWDGAGAVGGDSWVGFENYREAFGWGNDHERSIEATYRGGGGSSRPAVHTDPQLRISLINSLTYSAVVTPLSVAFALACALLVTQPIRGARWFGLAFYLPHLLSGAATILIWAWLFNPRWGPINQLIRGSWEAACFGWSAVGGECDPTWAGPGWLYSATWAKPAVVIMTLWSSGNAMLIFVASLRGIAPEMMEAARMDGAGSWARLRHLITPQLSPAMAFNLLTGWVAAMQAFAPAYLLYNREQRESLLFYMLHLYRAAFESPFRLGYACALAWILVLVLFLPISILALTRNLWITDDAETE